MKRRNFIKSWGITATLLIVSSQARALEVLEQAGEAGSRYKSKMIGLLNELRSEGSNLVKKIMNGKAYKFDPFVHYPSSRGIKDDITGCQLYFHAHRVNEYGHFHTFSRDEKGDLVHLVLISMDKDGNLRELATVNRWVTGDKYVKAEKLKQLSDSFYVAPSLFKDPRVVEFINSIFKLYRADISRLFEERDLWIKDYSYKYYREPFEDRNFDITSSVQVSLKSR